MKIAFDATPVFKQKTGIGYYAYNMIKNLLVVSPKSQYFLVSDKRPPSFQSSNEPFYGGPFHTEPLPNYRFLRFPLKGYYYLWRYMKLPAFDALTGIDADLYHGLNFFPLPSNRGKSVITIHDLYFLLHPKHIPLKTRATFVREIHTAAKKCDFILADSDSTRRDILEKLQLKPDKVRTVHLAAGDNFTYLNNEVVNQSTRHRYAKNHRYLLYLGTLEPRKNLVRLVHAFHLCKKRGLPYKLILAGGKGWFYEDIFRSIGKLQLEEDVLIPEYVPEEDLVPLYNASEMFIFPSLYEGFGLPVLEAMACGTPVITSNRSSMPEVVGDAGLLIDPEDIEGLAEAIEKVASDGLLRSALREKGLRRAAEFSWEKTALETLRVYQELL